MKKILDVLISENASLEKVQGLLKSNRFLITDNRVIDYPDSPTNKAFVGVAKKPLQKVKNGYGFLGVLLQTDNRMFIQCHICGEWMQQITNRHLESHKITFEGYRKKFGLLLSTSLVSDERSYSLEERGRKNINRFNSENLQRSAHAKKAVGQRVKSQSKIGIVEHNNRFGLCEKQLGFRLIEYIKKYKQLPSQHGSKGEGRSIYKALGKRFGSVNNGFSHYKLPTQYRKGTTVELVATNNKQLYFNYNKSDYSKEKVYEWIVKNTPDLQNNINIYAD